MTDPETHAREYLAASARALAALAEGELPVLTAKAGSLLRDTIASGGKVLFCGNGGSAADAQHLAAEMVGRLDASRERDPLPGIALTTDTSVLTAVSNDYGYEDVFARQVRGLGRRGDALVALTTSGSSPNVIRAAEAAREAGMSVIALLGPPASPLDELADVALHVWGETSGMVQQGHITIGHVLCALAETPRPT